MYLFPTVMHFGPSKVHAPAEATLVTNIFPLTPFSSSGVFTILPEGVVIWFWKETEKSQLEEDIQDVMDCGQKKKRMTEQGTKVGARAQESGVPEGITSLESCSGQVGGLYGCQDSVPKVCQGGLSRLDDGGGVQGDVQRGRQIKGD